MTSTAAFHAGGIFSISGRSPSRADRIRSLLSLLALVTAVLTMGASREVRAARQTGPIDVDRFKIAGEAWYSGSASDIGQVSNVFDGTVDTLFRSASINPAAVQVAFRKPVTLTRFRTHFSNAFGDPAYRWRIEMAESQADMDSRTGSYAEVVPWTETASDIFSTATLAAPVTARIVLLTAERLQGDDFVHIDEWQLFGTTSFNLLRNPRGVAVDASGRTLLAEAGTDRVVVYNPMGKQVGTIGGPGTANGRFAAPWDVAVASNERIHVVDRGNDRVQVFTSSGGFVHLFGESGTGSGEFKGPQGIGIDPTTGKIYVADTGNHRVQRFLPDGTLDESWSDDGIVGTTGSVRRDHSGFDGPTDVSVHPINGRVYVADRGNQRLEVFSQNGTYLRTFLAVYRANSLAFDNDGNLYIAGEDPNEGYRAFDGRLRFLRRADELITGHYTGGLADIGRIEGGVAVGADGRVVFSDVLRGRLVRTAPSLSPPIDGLRVEGNGRSVTFKWRTARASSGSVLLGSAPFEGSLFTDTQVGREHKVTVRGLVPDDRMYFRVSYQDPFDGSRRFTNLDLINSGVPPGRTQFLRLKAAGVIYTDTQAGPGYTKMDGDLLVAARTRFRRVAEFYWRNSGFRLWLDIHVVEIDRDIAESSIDPFVTMAPDLAAQGFGSADNFDAAWGTSTLAPSNGGGAGVLFGRPVATASWTTQQDFVAVHEISHSIDSMYQNMELDKYEFNHGIWAVPGGVGGDFSINGQILRNFLPASFTATKPPFTKIRTATDADNDSVPDWSPIGLMHPLSVTEATLASSTSSPDTDGDGLSDLQEALALPFHSTDPTVADTDGDGEPDGADANPAYRMGDDVAMGTPTIDGSIGQTEPWTVLTQGWGFSNEALVEDNDLYQGEVTTYAAWDQRRLYLALRGPATMTEVNLDGRADNRFMSPDNYILHLGNGSFIRDVAVNVGVPDLFRQIDDHGQFSVFLDTHPQFTKPYMGRPIVGHPDEGLGFPGRLITENHLLYGQGGSGDQSVWEVAIPQSLVTGFRLFPGKRLAIAFDVDGDILLETDHAAQLVLRGPLTPTRARELEPHVHEHPPSP